MSKSNIISAGKYIKSIHKIIGYIILVISVIVCLFPIVLFINAPDPSNHYFGLVVIIALVIILAGLIVMAIGIAILLGTAKKVVLNVSSKEKPILEYKYGSKKVKIQTPFEFCFYHEKSKQRRTFVIVKDKKVQLILTEKSSNSTTSTINEWPMKAQMIQTLDTIDSASFKNPPTMLALFAKKNQLASFVAELIKQPGITCLNPN